MLNLCTACDTVMNWVCRVTTGWLCASTFQVLKWVCFKELKDSTWTRTKRKRSFQNLNIFFCKHLKLFQQEFPKLLACEMISNLLGHTIQWQEAKQIKRKPLSYTFSPFLNPVCSRSLRHRMYFWGGGLLPVNTTVPLNVSFLMEEAKKSSAAVQSSMLQSNTEQLQRMWN